MCKSLQYRWLAFSLPGKLEHTRSHVLSRQLLSPHIRYVLSFSGPTPDPHLACFRAFCSELDGRGGHLYTHCSLSSGYVVWLQCVHEMEAEELSWTSAFLPLWQSARCEHHIPPRPPLPSPCKLPLKMAEVQATLLFAIASLFLLHMTVSVPA